MMIRISLPYGSVKEVAAGTTILEVVASIPLPHSKRHEIGNGSVVSGDFSTIDWADGPYYMKSDIDPAGGANYSISGASQLLSVPYALYSGASGGATNASLCKCLASNRFRCEKLGELQCQPGC